jgi:tellurite resistance protein TerC
MFIGAKLMLTYAHEVFDNVPKIPTPVSLAVIATILLISTIASLIKSRQNPEMRAHAGRISGHKDTEKK